VSIARSGTPFQAHDSTAATTAPVTFPSTAAAGSLGIIVAFWNTTGTWGATPSGWTVVPNSAQTAASPACIAYYKIVTAADQGATVTITGPGSAINTVCAFAYTGTQGFDTNGAQRNAASTSCAAPAVVAIGLADMLVMVGGAAAGAATFSAPTNGLSLWQATSLLSSGIADRQLSAAGTTGSSAMTVSVSAATCGLQFTLFQLDSDGESVTSKASGRSRILPFGRMLLLATGQDDQQPPLVADDAQIAGQIAGPGTGLPMRPWKRAARPRPSFEETAFLAPIIDADIGRPVVKYLPRFRRSRAGDEQQSLATPPPDERTVPRVPRLRAFRAPTQSVDESRTIVDDDAPRRRVRLARLRVPAGVAFSAERHGPVLAEEAGSPPLRRWDRFRRWVLQVAEDFGLIFIAAPSFRLTATLDPSLIFAVAILDSTAVFNATLNPPVIFGATLG
jgi:hypothetical protein